MTRTKNIMYVLPTARSVYRRKREMIHLVKTCISSAVHKHLLNLKSTKLLLSFFPSETRPYKLSELQSNQNKGSIHVCEKHD